MLLRTLVFMLLILLLSLAAAAQNTVRWNFSAPETEQADSVFLRILDSADKAVFADSVALSGSKTNIPTATLQPAKIPADIRIFGSGDRLSIRLGSSGTGEVTVSLFQIDGRLVCSEKFNLTPGSNEFSFSCGKLAPGVYVVNCVSPDAGKSVKIIARADGILTGGTPSNPDRDTQLKNAGIAGWKYIISHPRLLTDTFTVDYSPVMNVEGAVAARPTVSLEAIDVFTRKGEYGEARTLGQMTPVPNLDVMIGDVLYGKTDFKGAFSFRPDMVGNQRVLVIDRSENFYSKWYDVSLTSGSVTEVKDFKAEAVFMVENYVDNLGKRLVEATWFMGTYKQLSNTNFVAPLWPDSILTKKGVWIDPVYKDGKHDHALSDINEQIKKFHVSGMPKLFEANENNAYIYIHYGGTLAQGQCEFTYRQNEEGLYYKTRVDVYVNTLWADFNDSGYHPIYALLEHEIDRVYFAYLEFEDKQYVMWPDAISRCITYGYSPENSQLEDKILMLVANGPTHLQLHNNFLPSGELNFPGYNGTKSASINNTSALKAFEKMFPGAVIESGTDKLGKYITVTSKN